MASIEMRFEAVELNELPQGVSVDGEEKVAEDRALGMPIFRGWKDGKDPARDWKRRARKLRGQR